MKIALLILSWQDAQAAICCAESAIVAANRSQHEWTLSIVDNGSVLSCKQLLRSWCSKQNNDLISLIENDENFGFSKGMNKAIFTAVKHQGIDYFWLLNNDVVCSPDSLLYLMNSAIDKPNVAIWGPTVVEHNSSIVQCAGGCRYYSWLGIASAIYSGFQLRDLDELPNEEPDYIYGAAMFLRGDFLLAIGGLAEDYFLYFEELDLTENLAHDDSISWCKQAVVEHVGGGSVTDKKTQWFVTYHAALSAFKYTKKYRKRCLYTVILARVVGNFLQSIVRLKPWLFTAVIRALSDFISEKPAIKQIY